MQNNYEFVNKKEKIKIAVYLEAIFLMICLLFYRNIILSLIFSFSFIFVYKKKINDTIDNKKKKVLLDFKEFINLLSVSCATGDEPKKAFMNSYNEFVKISSCVDFRHKLRECKNYIETYNDFLGGMQMLSDTFNIDEIQKFYDSIAIAQRATGDINSILHETTYVISNRIELENEIEKIFYEKKYELKIMLAIPIIIYGFLSVTAFEFIKPIYESVTGYIVITICLLLLLGAYLLGEKMMSDEIKNA